MKNIELKVKIDQFEEIYSGLNKLGAVFCEQLLQKDTYFSCQKGKLKVREMNQEKFELIFYSRPDKKSSKISDYSIHKLNKNQADLYMETLGVAYGMIAEVNKSRELWMFKNTRIHLDQVVNLGKFIELETVITDQKINFQSEHNQIARALKLANYSHISVSYSDLIMKKDKNRSHIFTQPHQIPIPKLNF